MPTKPPKKTKPIPPLSNKSPNKQAQQQQQQQQPRPNWPALKPLIPTSDLLLTPILHDQIYIIRNFLTSTLCKTYVSFLASLPLLTTPGNPKRDEAVRVNDRLQLDDPVFADRLWRETGLRELVAAGPEEEDEEEGNGTEREDGESIWGGEVLGLNPNIRIYRYSPGQFFAQHYDESVSLQYSPHQNPSSPPIPAKTTWTLLIYLTTCSGGETVFYPDPPSRMTKKAASKQVEAADAGPVAVGLEVGMALLHRHGDRCLLHEGREVKGGEKWVIRSDLVVRR